MYLFPLFFTTFLTARIGYCCEYGRNPKLPSSYNYQQQFFVECYCNCADTMGPCHECGHFHAPKEKQIIVQSKKNIPKINSLTVPPQMQSVLNQLAKNYKVLP
jgi:hypothetical protein